MHFSRSGGRRAFLDKEPQDVAAMFDAVADHYDAMNSLASLGQDRLWRRALRDALAPKPGQLVLDLAAGTGTSAHPLARAGAQLVCVDLSEGMVAEGRKRHPDFTFIVGDALGLPLADDTFDAATTSFGLRNVQDTVAALRELWRVTKPGGALVVCEFSTPVALCRAVYHAWIKRVVPRVARVVSPDPAAYAYLRESILTWPDQRALAELMEEAGWRDIEWRNLSAGIVALHRAKK
ncbi:MAG: demethylmenaquinone methyltransferase [Propionibacteriaceae bacterium]|jgi:demethylmenaquinone methyltransferase/2-methoxy-6-polyprenyl-1,4-benzoquinol methylase|nr:demethylmenaquinone methyltransferase [Propionibacteriaceae bacterium]